MTTPPRFEELLGPDVDRDERERLRHVHDLLVIAGPPAELPPHVEAGPTLAMTLNRAPAKVTRRVALLAATICILGVAFLFGYLAGNNGSGLARGQTLRLAGTRAAPGALASLRILPSDTSGNWPMRLTGTGLPRLGTEQYYEVDLVRNGKIFAPCGSFIAKNSTSVDVTLNAPYELQPHDRWVVVRRSWSSDKRGPVVLRPTT